MWLFDLVRFFFVLAFAALVATAVCDAVAFFRTVDAVAGRLFAFEVLGAGIAMLGYAGADVMSAAKTRTAATQPHTDHRP